MQTATATVAGRRRVSFTLPEPAATTFIPRDVESPSRGDDAARRSTWPPTRTERYPEGLRKAPAPTRSESEPGPTKTCLLDLAFADESRAVDADAYEELRLGDDFFDYTAWLFFACAITLRCIFHEHVVSLALCWWILPAVIPWWLMLPYHVDPRGSHTAALYRGFLIAEDMYRVWTVPRLVRVVVFLAATRADYAAPRGRRRAFAFRAGVDGRGPALLRLRLEAPRDLDPARPQRAQARRDAAEVARLAIAYQFCPRPRPTGLRAEGAHT